MGLNTKLVRVELESDDGEIRVLTGIDAEKWQQDVNALIWAEFIRYSTTKFGPHNWKILREGTNGKGKDE